MAIGLQQDSDAFGAFSVLSGGGDNKAARIFDPINLSGWADKEDDYDEFASDTRAKLARADWDRYKALYQPLEDILFGMVEDKTGRQDAMNTAAQMSTNRFDEAGDAFQRQARGLGLQLTEGQQQSFDRRQDVSAGLTRVGAANTAGRNYDALRRIILGGGG